MELVAQVPTTGQRVVLGIAGEPGAGKTTLALELVAALTATGRPAVQVPMDGFHYADVELDRRGLRQRKGAPESFDAEGYAALLARLHEEPGPVLAPAFDRSIEQPVAGSIAVLPEHEVVVTEGNYLLHPRWAPARARLTQVWWVRQDEQVRREQLLRRHVEHGKSPAEAAAWEERVDQANAVLMRTQGAGADLVIDLARDHA